MLLRRVTKNICDQNWTAITFDFLIVVSGVYLGIQLGNWNETRVDQQDYRDALGRYRAELRTNLETLDTVDKDMEIALQRVGSGLDALYQCDDSDVGKAAIEAAIRGAAGTYGLKLRTGALTTLTQTPRFLSLQSESVREVFSDTQYTLDVFLREASYLETIPLAERIQNNPIIEVGPPIRRSVTYLGEDYSRVERSLNLAVPVTQACTDNTLIKSLFTWERWQVAIPAIITLLRARLKQDLALLDEIAPE